MQDTLNLDSFEVLYTPFIRQLEILTFTRVKQNKLTFNNAMDSNDHNENIDLIDNNQSSVRCYTLTESNLLIKFTLVANVMSGSYSRDIFSEKTVRNSCNSSLAP